jgi:hypothetical protein
MMAMFFLPFGYDVLFQLTMKLTGSYWKADMVFYGLSGGCWLSYYYLSKKCKNKESS